MIPYTFRAARPVWEKGAALEKNRTLMFRALVPGGTDARLALACHTKYQILINGAFFAEGPARAAHGFYRVSEYALGAALTKKTNVVCILAAGYNVNSFSLLDAPSFLCAELFADGELLCATGTGTDFACAAFEGRIKKAARYSFQRPFTEAYILDAGYDLFFTDPGFQAKQIVTEETEEKTFIAREVRYCDYPERKAAAVCASGSLSPAKEQREIHDRRIDGIGEKLGGFARAELDWFPTKEVCAFEHTVTDESRRPVSPYALSPDRFVVYDFGVNTTGFLRLSVTPAADTVLYAVFTQKLKKGEKTPDVGDDSCENAVKWVLQGGRSYDLVTFEPYTIKYLELFALYAPVLVTNVSVYGERCPDSALTNRKTFDDPALQEVYDAAVETFCQNATDIFMDCPSRERAGWLCDSFFTARAEFALTGQSVTERAFLENFLLPEAFPHLPQGMLPMCYPSDHPDGTFIPNWAMWYVLELREYYLRTGDWDLVDEAEEKVYGLCGYFERLENADGLLENLEGWVFIEWSKANDYTQDVSYPSNMLYALFLETVGALYNDKAKTEKAAALKETIRRQAFDGEFFVDNAVKDETGVLRPTGNRTETNQYYAFFTGVAAPERYPALFETMLRFFGPARDPASQYPEIAPANAFIGNFLRLELLRRAGRYAQLREEIKAFFLPMARATGTLWENMTDSASCCHGFSSAVAYFLTEEEEEEGRSKAAQ